MKHQHAKKHTAVAQGLAILVLSAPSALQPVRVSDGSAVVPRSDEVGAIIRLPAAVAGKRYSRQLVLGGKPPYTVVVEAGRLDDLGLSLDAKGLLSGLPKEPGRLVFTVAVQDAQAGEAVRQRFELQVLKARQGP